MSLSSAYFFLFWFVCSFCVFNLLHAFKPLSSFSPLGQNCRSLFRRDFGSALTSFAVLELFHKNKPLTTLRCRSLLFLLLRDFVRCAHFIRCLGIVPQKQAAHYTALSFAFVFATSGLRSLRSHPPYTIPLRPTQIRFSPKKEKMNKKNFLTSVFQSKQRKKYFIF